LCVQKNLHTDTEEASTLRAALVHTNGGSYTRTRAASHEGPKRAWVGVGPQQNRPTDQPTDRPTAPLWRRKPRSLLQPLKPTREGGLWARYCRQGHVDGSAEAARCLILGYEVSGTLSAGGRAGMAYAAGANAMPSAIYSAVGMKLLLRILLASAQMPCEACRIARAIPPGE